MHAASAQLFLGLEGPNQEPGLPTGDCVTMGSHEENRQHAIKMMQEAAKTGGKVAITDTTVSLLIDGKSVARWLFTQEHN